MFSNFFTHGWLQLPVLQYQKPPWDKKVTRDSLSWWWTYYQLKSIKYTQFPASIYFQSLNVETSWALSWNQFGMILRSSMSNSRVLSISPWFLSTKSNARWPCGRHQKNCIIWIKENNTRYTKKTWILLRRLLVWGHFCWSHFQDIPILVELWSCITVK